MAVRVGRYDWKTKTSAYAPGYTNIIIHPGQPYGDLSPYALKTPEGYFIENAYQFARIYPRVYHTTQYSYIKGYRGKQKIWEHSTEDHLDENGYPTEAYWVWREKGMTNEFAIRYPNSYQHRREGLGAYYLPDGEEEYVLLDYIEARKKIYCQEYIRSFDYYLREQPCSEEARQIRELKERVANGEKLQIVEVDGPTRTDGSPYDTVREGIIGEPLVDSLIANKNTIVRALNNPSRSFGHGYVVATLIQTHPEWLH